MSPNLDTLFQIKTYFLVVTNHIGDVMVSMLISSAVDHEFETRSDQTKDYKIGICCFSANHYYESEWVIVV
jgi:hypothetical protein